MNRLSAVLALAALALVLFNFGCEQNKPQEPVAQDPEPVVPEPYPYAQVPEVERSEPAYEPGPALTEIDNEPITTIDSEPAAPRPKVTSAKPKENYAPPKKAARTYTVRKNDTLQKISQKHYGTTKNWRKIFDANKNKLKDPNKIPVGVKLVIP